MVRTQEASSMAAAPLTPIGLNGSASRRQPSSFSSRSADKTRSDSMGSPRTPSNPSNQLANAQYRRFTDSVSRLGNLHKTISEGMFMPPTSADDARLTELVRAMGTQMEHQNAVNEASMNLHKFHYMVSYANHLRSRKLELIARQGQERIQELKLQSISQTRKIAELQTTLNSMEEEVAKHEEISADLQAKLNQTRDDLQRAIEEYKKDREKQKAELEKHSQLIKQLMQAKLRSAALIDASAALLGYLVSSSVVVQFPLSALRNALQRTGPRGKSIDRFLRIFVWLALSKGIRDAYTQTGICDAFSWTPYRSILWPVSSSSENRKMI
eukprot:Clim_evm236s157 gene=Clim_evmTU236s157